MCHSFSSPFRAHPFLATLAILSATLTTAPAFAANRHAQERAARKACLNGDYTTGVSILSDLFVDTRDPTYIFNQGRCFEQNRRYEDAQARFDEYLRAANLSAEDRAAAEKHIADCKEKLDKERASSPLQPTVQQPVAAAPAVSAVPAVQEPTPSEPVSVVTQPVPTKPATEKRWGLVTAGVITGVVGAGAIVAGVAFNIKANNLVADMESTPGSYRINNTDQKNYKTYAWIGYGAGAACLATSAALIALGVLPSRSSASQVALAPMGGQGQLGVSWTGGF